jgi:acyl-CoA synthetase (AMP-forming)/AMP-acid ligase II
MADPSNPSVNLAGLVLNHARNRPDQLALVVPELSPDGASYTETKMSFGELGARVAQCRAGLQAQGFKRGDRIILMAPLSLDLYALLLGIFASGMSGVFIDTGMDKKKILHAVRDSKADAMVSMGALFKYRFVLRSLWGLRKYSVDSSGLGVRPMSALFGDDTSQMFAKETGADEHALITFTSGSTGRPKGADRTQGLLTAQHLALEEHFPNQGDEFDMPCFPVVTLHNLCCGVPTILPAVDFKAPGAVNPEFIFEQIERWGINQMSGAPAYIEKLVAHLESKDVRETRIKRMAVGGAPVPMGLCQRISERFPQCDAQVVYGSTEAEPIASVSMTDVLADKARADDLGLLVGTVAHAATVALVNLPEGTSQLDEQGIAPYQVPAGDSGELVVSGPHVNRCYLDNPDANRENKLYAQDDVVWHRTGDVASFDEAGRLWLQGRVKDLVRHGEKQVQPLAIEAAVDRIEGVRRASLLNPNGSNQAVLAVEAANFDVTSDPIDQVLQRFGLQGVRVLQVAQIPMDYRHNSKIDRVALRTQLET